MDEGIISTDDNKVDGKSLCKACMTCGTTFSFVPKRGRPPSKCDKCRGPVKAKLSVADAVAQVAAEETQTKEKDL